MSIPNIPDDFLKSKAAKNPFGKDENDQPAPIGTSVTGKITDVQIRQVTDIQTREPQTWPDGNPKQQATITLQTAERDDEEDDGLRSVYVKMWGLQKTALIEASREAGGSPAVGDTFTATFVGVGKKTNPAFSAPKLYKYEIKKGSPLEASLGVQTTPASSAPAGVPATETFPPALTESQKTLAIQLIGVSQTDEQIAQVISAPVNLVAGLRETLKLQAVATASGPGF